MWVIRSPNIVLRRACESSSLLGCSLISTTRRLRLSLLVLHPSRDSSAVSSAVLFSAVLLFIRLRTARPCELQLYEKESGEEPAGEYTNAL